MVTQILCKSDGKHNEDRTKSLDAIDNEEESRRLELFSKYQEEQLTFRSSELDELLQKAEPPAVDAPVGKEVIYGFELSVPPNYSRKFLCSSESDCEAWIGVINFYSLGMY